MSAYVLSRVLAWAGDPRQYWLAVGVHVALSLAFAASVVTGRIAVGLCTAALALGALLYTWGEYAFHRWIAHGLIGAAMSPHHDAPDQRFTVPWWTGPLFVAGVWPVLAAGTTPAVASSLFLGATVVHLYADLQHALQHRTTTRRFLRPHHLHHHAHPTVNFGVTTRLWDRVYGTLERP